MTETKARPAGDGPGGVEAAAGDIDTPTIPPPADHDAADRQGMRRVTLSRSSSGRCHNCGRDFASLAGAVSHGRSAGHLVEARYSAAYLYVPTTDVGAA